MTEPERPLDPLDELASAILDGEAALEEQARAGEPAIAERLARFRRVAAALGEPVDVTDAQRDAAVRAALAAFGARDGAPADELAARRRASARRWLPAAAAVLVVAGAIGLIAVTGDDDRDPDVVAAQLETDEESGEDLSGGAGDGAADRATQNEALAEDSTGAIGPSPLAAAIPGRDLGPRATIDDLVAAVAAYSPYSDSFTVDDSDATTSTTPSCTPQRDGEVLLRATATVDGEPLHVFVVATPDGNRLLAYSIDGCEERYDEAV
jgi:hypothetical protein